MDPQHHDARPVKAETGGALDARLVAELAAADAEAVQLNGVAVPAGALQVPPPPPTQAQELASLLLLAGQAAGIVFPSVAPIYTETRCRAVAEGVAPALERLGVRLPAGLGGVWMGAAAAVFPLAWETREAVLRDLARMRAEAEAARKREQGEKAPKAPEPAPAPVVAEAPKRATEADVLRPPGSQ